MSQNFQTVLISQLLSNEDFFVKVLPYLKPEYFEDPAHRTVFEEVERYAGKYKTRPSQLELQIEVKNREDLNEKLFASSLELAGKLSPEDFDRQWLLDKAEKFCKDRALYLAMSDAIQIMSGESKKYSPTAIPDILREALSISFDPHVGHDYFENWEEAYKKYTEKVDRIPFKLQKFNQITKGGCHTKTLNLLMADTGAFKSGTLCDFSAYWLSQGYDVLYITLEMAEERIRERIDANLFKMNIDSVHALPKTMFFEKLQRIKAATSGRLIIKEYPPASVSVSHLRSLLSDLDLKYSFRPKIIVVDYLNLMVSSRYRSNESLYTANKAVAEELRGLAVEYNVPLWSAVQANRSGSGSSDLSTDSVSESYGIPMTADFLVALISTPEFYEKNQILVKQLKNRYNDKGIMGKFVIGVNRAQMTLFDIADDSSDDVVKVTPIMSSTQRFKFD